MRNNANRKDTTGELDRQEALVCVLVNSLRELFLL